MPRPADTPRLVTLDPDDIAAEVDRRLDAFLSRFAALLAPGLLVRAERSGKSGIALMARNLCIYAQRGPGAGECETHGEARSACLSLVECLWSNAADALLRGGYLGPIHERKEDPTADLDLYDPLSLVLIAGWARSTLCSPCSDGEPWMTARQLAALAGLDPISVRELARVGEVKLQGTRPAVASQPEAKRWLGARGIKGL